MKATPRILLFCFLGSTLPAAAAPPGSKTFEFKYINPERVRDLFSGQAFLLLADRDGKFLTARGPQSFLDEVEAAVKRLDVQPPAPKDVQVVIYLIGLTSASPGAMKLPPELLNVNASFKQYSLLDMQMVRVRESEGGEARNLEAPNPKLAGIGRVRFRCVSVSDAEGKKTLSFDGLQIDLDIPGAASNGRGGSRLGEGSAIEADIDVAEKQPAIVGKTGRETPIVVLVSAETAS